MKTATATIRTLQLSFFSTLILSPTEIPANARIGAVVPKNSASLV